MFRIKVVKAIRLHKNIDFDIFWIFFKNEKRNSQQQFRYFRLYQSLCIDFQNFCVSNQYVFTNLAKRKRDEPENEDPEIELELNPIGPKKRSKCRANLFLIRYEN